MKQQITKGIILSRIDYGEADRIITFLTPDLGKLRLIAKGVRRVKSKLAGGIELFSISQITFITGRSEIGTLISTRLIEHFGSIVSDIDRTMTGYNLLKQMNKSTEDEMEQDYFNLLEKAMESLNQLNMSPQLIQFWYSVQLLKLSGHTPNLGTDYNGRKLVESGKYDFNFDDTAFENKPNGRFSADHIKFLRLAFDSSAPKTVSLVKGNIDYANACTPIISTMIRENLRI